MLRTARPATALSAGAPSGVTACTTTSRAARAATLEVPARNVATDSGAPSYASGVHAWNGTSESLKPSPARASTTASTRTARRPGSAAACSAAPASKNAWPVAASHRAAARASMAKETSEVVSRATAPETAARAPRSATSATIGRVASSSATSQVPRSRAAATAVAPAVAVSTRLAVTAARPGGASRSSGQASSRVTSAPSRAASCSPEPTAVAA